MFYILVVVVSAGHIYQKTYDDGIYGLFTTRAACETSLARIKGLPPKKGVTAVMSCQVAYPEFNELVED